MTLEGDGITPMGVRCHHSEGVRCHDTGGRCHVAWGSQSRFLYKFTASVM